VAQIEGEDGGQANGPAVGIDSILSKTNNNPRISTEQAKEQQDGMYQLNHFRDIHNIRKVTKNQFKELGSILDERKGRVPIFGYPLFNFSPLARRGQQQGELQFPEFDVEQDEP